MIVSPSGSDPLGVQVSVLSTVAGSGVRATVGASGARFPSVMVVELDAVAELLSVTVTSQVMTSNPKSINPNILASEALRIMNASKVTCLFVIDNGSPVGIIRIHDILRAGVA